MKNRNLLRLPVTFFSVIGLLTLPTLTIADEPPSKPVEEKEEAKTEEKAKPKAEDISVAKAAEKIEAIEKTPEIVILDVRTPTEFAEGHVHEKAKNIDFLGDDFEEKVAKLDKEKTYLLYCRSGGRSSGAMKKMEAMGFQSLLNMEGGITAWKEAGKEVTQKTRKESE